MADAVWVYNRVGKSGSSSLHPLLSSNCLALEVPTTRFVFGYDLPSMQRRRQLLRKMVSQLRSMNTTRPCRVLWGHFTYATPPDERVRYINMIREPVERWRSLRNFYAIHFASHPVSTATINASACLRQHAAHSNASRACVAAEDSHMADVLFPTAEESRRCNVSNLMQRYTFIATLERERAHVPQLLRLLGLTDLAANLSNRSEALPHLYRTRLVPQSMRRVDETERQILEGELECDRRVYHAAEAFPGPYIT